MLRPYKATSFMKLNSFRLLVSCLGASGLLFGSAVAAQAQTSAAVAPSPRIAQPVSLPSDAPAKVWLSLGFGTSDERAPDWKWLRAQCQSNRVLDSFDAKRVAALVIPVFDDGRAFYDTQVAPFKGRNANASEEETALRELIARAQAANVPVYLGLDVLGWQKVDDRAQWPTARNAGIFDSVPEMQEINKEFSTAPPRGTLYASPFNARVRSATTALLSEVAQKFPKVEGVVLDVRLSREEITGYSGAARVAAMKALHFDPLDLGLQGKADDVIDEKARLWLDWRQREMQTFVRDLSSRYKSLRPNNRVLVCGVADYQKQADFNALRTGQDWSSWTRSRAADGVLLEGHWLPRYEERAVLVAAVQAQVQSEVAQTQSSQIAVSNGSALSSESSYSRDWKSLHSANPLLDSMAVVVRNDDELKAAAALLRGEDIVPVAPAPQMGELGPDWSLTDSLGKRWSARELRGQRAVAMLLVGKNATFTSASLAQIGTISEKLRGQNIEPFVVSPSALANANSVNDLVDAAGEVLSSFGSGLTLLMIDRAGFVRSVRALDSAAVVQTLGEVSDPTPKLQEGQNAPDFVIGDMNGRVRRLSDLRGKKNLLLTFFPKCFTGGCTNHLTSLQAEKAAFDANDTEVLAVSIDAADVQIPFAQRWNLTFPLVPDVGRNLSMLYGAAQNTDDLAMRQTVFIDKNGIVRFIDRNVDVHTHGADVLTKMRALKLAK